MNKFFIIIFLFLNFHKSLLAIDFGNYLAGESALNNKDNKAAIYYFKNAIDLNKPDTKFGQDVAQKLCALYLLEGEIDKCILLGKKIEKNLTSDSIVNTNILMALIVGDIKKKKFSSALNKLKISLTKDVNLLPIIIECIKNSCTLGEICQVMRDIYGEYL